ncbi:MAG: hypothetical protein HUJ75_02960 [Parasporobacterium sp.]|nr:hypothetical protein [Parasporobacterium sp.]
MRYCESCGTMNDTNARFCQGCGKAFANAPASDTDQTDFRVNPEQETVYTAPAPQPVPVPVQPAAQAAPVKKTSSVKTKVFGSIGFAGSICSLLLSWIPFFGMAGIIASVVCLIFCNISRKSGSFTLAKIGKILSVIGIILAALWFVFWIVVVIAGGSNIRYRNNYWEFDF